MKAISHKLKQPFPFSRGFKTELFSVLRTCILASIFLIVLRPFGLEGAKTITLIGFGVVVFISAIVNLLFSKFILSRFINEDHWTVQMEIVRTLGNLVVNVLAIITFTGAVLNVKLDGLSVLKFFSYTILFSIVPISVRTLHTMHVLLKQELEAVKGIKHSYEAEHSSVPRHETMTLKSNLVNEQITFALQDLLCIEAEKNYINILTFEEGELKRHLLRLSLVKALEQIPEGTVIRCHRSYLVNLNTVSNIIGNAQGIKLVLISEVPPIPVSRTYRKTIIEQLERL